jgi:hypothetical protein
MNRSARWGTAAILALALAGCAPEPEGDTVPAPGATDPTPGAGGADAPALDGSAPDVRLVLPARFEQALAADGAGFTAFGPADVHPEIVRGTGGWSYPWNDRQAPWAVVGDFDGDGRRDAALLQRSSDAIRAVAVLDTPAAPTVHELQRAAFGALGKGAGEPSEFYLTLHPAGPRSVPDFGGERGGRDSTVTLPNEGITVAYFGKAAATHYHAGGRFHRLTTAD